MGFVFWVVFVLVPGGQRDLLGLHVRSPSQLPEETVIGQNLLPAQVIGLPIGLRVQQAFHYSLRSVLYIDELEGARSIGDAGQQMVLDRQADIDGFPGRVVQGAVEDGRAQHRYVYVPFAAFLPNLPLQGHLSGDVRARLPGQNSGLQRGLLSLQAADRKSVV